MSSKIRKGHHLSSSIGNLQQLSSEYQSLSTITIVSLLQGNVAFTGRTECEEAQRMDPSDRYVRRALRRCDHFNDICSRRSCRRSIKTKWKYWRERVHSFPWTDQKTTNCGTFSGNVFFAIFLRPFGSSVERSTLSILLWILPINVYVLGDYCQRIV